MVQMSLGGDAMRRCISYFYFSIDRGGHGAGDVGLQPSFRGVGAGRLQPRLLGLICMLQPSYDVDGMCPVPTSDYTSSFCVVLPIMITLCIAEISQGNQVCIMNGLIEKFVRVNNKKRSALHDNIS